MHALLHDAFRETAATHPSRAAIIADNRTLTYAELDRLSDRVAALLRTKGVTRGDRVALLLENSLDVGVCVWGILKAGAVLLPLTPGAKPARLRYVLDDATPKVLIAQGNTSGALHEAFANAAHRPTIVWSLPPQGRENEPSLERAYADASPIRLDDLGQIDQDLAALIYTSGTTGEPKGVMLTQRNLVNTSGVVAQYLGQTEDDLTCCVLPLSFSYGLFQLFASARVGAGVLLEKSFAFPFQVFESIKAHRATMFPAVPTVFAKIIQMMPGAGEHLASIRLMTNAAAALPPAHVLKVHELFPRVRFFPMYGQTECTRAAYLDPSLVATHPDSVGGRIPNSEIYLVDEHGSRLPLGSTGELVVRGANVMRGYWKRPADTDKKLKDGEIPGEKVLHTGDVFRTDARGLFYFVSRTDDIFKCRGEKVSPREIEHAVCELPEVAEAAVIGVEDPADGMAIKLFVVPKDGVALTEARIRQHCKARLEAGLMPKFVELRSSLPKTDSGKLRRIDLVAPKG